MSVEERIQKTVDEHPVVLFMKGTRQAPQCGFSARVVDILDQYLEGYQTVNVLADPEVRSGIKTFSNWPTIPQLYVDGKFVGGSDIVHEMAQSGELEEVLGAAPLDTVMPTITVTAAARNAFIKFWEDPGEPVVRLTISASFDPLLDLDEVRPGDMVIPAEGMKLVLNPATGRRADGVTIDFVERNGQMGFKVENPNRPAQVQSLSPEELASWRKANRPHLLLDVRTAEERATARIDGDAFLEEIRPQIEDLDRGKTLVIYCHHGVRSRQAARHLLSMGFTDVHNLEGGIEAWSTRVDPGVPRY
jgi:monothiol glutaredoxin